MALHNELGVKGERLAHQFLAKKGYKVLEKNFRFGHLEVDIIAQFKGVLVVVEVKTRQNEFMAEPEITVNRSKQRSIIKVTNHYIHKNQIDAETRFDIISVLYTKKGRFQMVHHVDAFYPTIY